MIEIDEIGNLPHLKGGSPVEESVNPLRCLKTFFAAASRLMTAMTAIMVPKEALPQCLAEDVWQESCCLHLITLYISTWRVGKWEILKFPNSIPLWNDCIS